MVKLRDGMWLPAEGVRTEYAEEIYNVTPLDGEKGLSLLCPVGQIRTRGNTLNMPTVTLVSQLTVADHLNSRQVGHQVRIRRRHFAGGCPLGRCAEQGASF